MIFFRQLTTVIVFGFIVLSGINDYSKDAYAGTTFFDFIESIIALAGYYKMRKQKELMEEIQKYLNKFLFAAATGTASYQFNFVKQRIADLLGFIWINIETLRIEFCNKNLSFSEKIQVILAFVARLFSLKRIPEQKSTDLIPYKAQTIINDAALSLDAPLKTVSRSRSVPRLTLKRRGGINYEDLFSKHDALHGQDALSLQGGFNICNSTKNFAFVTVMILIISFVLMYFSHGKIGESFTVNYNLPSSLRKSLETFFSSKNKKSYCETVFNEYALKISNDFIVLVQWAFHETVNFMTGCLNKISESAGDFVKLNLHRFFGVDIETMTEFFQDNWKIIGKVIQHFLSNGSQLTLKAAIPDTVARGLPFWQRAYNVFASAPETFALGQTAGKTHNMIEDVVKAIETPNPLNSAIGSYTGTLLGGLTLGVFYMSAKIFFAIFAVLWAILELTIRGTISVAENSAVFLYCFLQLIYEDAKSVFVGLDIKHVLTELKHICDTRSPKTRSPKPRSPKPRSPKSPGISPLESPRSARSGRSARSVRSARSLSIRPVSIRPVSIRPIKPTTRSVRPKSISPNSPKSAAQELKIKSPKSNSQFDANTQKQCNKILEQARANLENAEQAMSPSPTLQEILESSLKALKDSQEIVLKTRAAYEKPSHENLKDRLNALTYRR